MPGPGMSFSASPKRLDSLPNPFFSLQRDEVAEATHVKGDRHVPTQHERGAFMAGHANCESFPLRSSKGVFAVMRSLTSGPGIGQSRTWQESKLLAYNQALPSSASRLICAPRLRLR